MDLEQMGPQTFLYGCELKAGKEITFNPEDDDYDHQLSVRMACVDPTTKDELNVVEIEGHDVEGQKVKAVLATLKPSTLPSVSLGGFEITPPVVFRLRSGSGPVHISGQHLVIMGGDQSFDEEEEEEEEEEVKTSKKRPASLAQNPSKKMKIDEEEEEEEDDDEDDDDEEEESEEESPVKQKKPASKPQTPAQNGKGPKPSTPAAKQNKTPEKKNKGDKGQSPKTPQTPRVPLTVQEIKAKMLSTVQKGGSLPKVQVKFDNFVKNCFKETDQKVIDELWKWRQAQEK